MGTVLLVLISMSLAFYTGFRVPGDWSINYFQTAWQDGIYRRAFAGTLLHPFGCMRFDVHAIHVIQLSALAGMLGMAVFAALRSAQGLVLALFFFSAGGGFLFHQAGYMDQLLWLLAGLAVASVRRFPWVASALMGVAILLHEIALALVIPVMVAWLVLDGERSARRWAVIFLLPVVALLSVYVAVQCIAPEALEVFFARAQACEFEIPRMDYYENMSDPVEYYNNYAYSYGEYIGDWASKLVPPLLFAWAVVLGIGQKMTLTPLSRVVLFGVCVVPLLLGFVAWDTERWLMLSNGSRA
jgi:hypothetical protein